MRKVKARNTSPEMKVRRLIWAMGFRGYRVNYDGLPGKPDIVFTKRKKVIFVHGCFWHGHDCRAGRNTPKSNGVYWNAKLARNQERDGQRHREIKEMGWDVLILWECELKREVADVCQQIYKSLL